MTTAPTTPAVAIDCQNVAVTYQNGFTAVQDVNLQVAAGEIVAVLGASGSGKSSLLRGIAGLEQLSAGRISLNDRVLVDADDSSAWVQPHQRHIGFVFQTPQLFPHRTVGGNIRYGLDILGGPKAEREQRVAELLELVELTGYENRNVSTLSGGQAQRVALARALAPRPEALLLDEPLSALDRRLRAQLAVEIRRLLTTMGIPGLYVTHDEAEAFTVADRVAVIDQGRVVALGTEAELRASTLAAVTDLLDPS